MTISVQSGDAASRTTAVRIGAVSVFVLAFAFGVSSGASAQCAGSYHPGSGAGSRGAAASNGGEHSASMHSATSSSSCATNGTAANASRLASFHPAGEGLAGQRGARSGHRAEAKTADAAHGKKATGAAVKP